jgi:hypothetical protein
MATEKSANEIAPYGVKRITLTDALCIEADARMLGCDHCGDDISLHIWVDITVKAIEGKRAVWEVINCDRSES